MLKIIKRTDKPKKTAAQLIKQLENKGVKFHIISRVEAYNFLTNRNNYMRLASYRKNYETSRGINQDKYINLEFAYLVELSALDMHLRNFIIKMCLDVEHSLKVRLINDVEKNDDEDGYQIVDKFLAKKENEYICKYISRFSNSHFCGDLIKKYFDIRYNGKSIPTGVNGFECPVWVLTELLQFGDFLKLYCFYNKEYNKPCIDESALKLTKSLRNACAHNNCIMHDLHISKTTKPPAAISQYVSQIKGLGKTERRSKLSSQFLLEFTALLFVYEKVVTSDIKKHTFNDLHKFANNRLVLNLYYFDKNDMVRTSIIFLKKLLTIRSD